MNTTNNPMSEYLLKLQLIITNTEFKNGTMAKEYETVESKTLGDKYVRAMNGKDSFIEYQYNGRELRYRLSKMGYDEDTITKMLENDLLLPTSFRQQIFMEKHNEFINNYVEQNPYYARLSGYPFVGNDQCDPDEVVYIPDEFYNMYASTGEIYRGEPIHELSDKMQELFMNSKYYEQTMKEHPEALYLKYIGSNKIPIEISRSTEDAGIMRINTSKLSTNNELYGVVTVSSDVIHMFVNVYNKTKDYIFYTLRGDFSNVYANYDSFMRFLTIYMSIGNCLSYFMKASSELRMENNAVANNFFALYGFPSIIMEGNNTGEFLAKFRQLLMDKGTNTVYRVKDLIGYDYTDIYTLVMVKQQKFENGVPIYKTLDDGSIVPVQDIVFRRLGTADDNTSYFKFREESKSYPWREIADADPRWWNTPEVEQMLNDMNYTLSNSKYIQLSTHMSFDDIWWQCVIFLRGILDNRNEAINTPITINFNIENVSSVNLFEAVLALVILMNNHLIDANGRTMDGTLPIKVQYNGTYACIDTLLEGLDSNGKPIYKDGNPYKLTSFNWNFRTEKALLYNSIKDMIYIDPNEFLPMLDSVLDRQNKNLGDAALNDTKLIYEYLVDKMRTSQTISEFREVTELFKGLFLVDPARDWYDHISMDTTSVILSIYDLSLYDYSSFQYFFDPTSEPQFSFEYNHNVYNINLYDILNNDVYNYKYDGEYIFRVHDIVEAFDDAMKTFKYPAIEKSSLNENIKNNYQSIIMDKVDLDLSNTINGPTSFDKLLMRENVYLYRYIRENKNDHNQMVMLLRAIIKGLEAYTNSSLAGLEMSVLGQDQYMNILKEVITYFKSYMVEFTKEEFIYVFDGLMDNGGNSNMIKLLDEITNAKINLLPKDSETLHDIAAMDMDRAIADDNVGLIYDDCIFRLEGTYQALLDTGYDVWYDDGNRITKTPPTDITADTMVIADISRTGDSSSSSSAYKIIININNTDIPNVEDANDHDTWYGNIF